MFYLMLFCDLLNVLTIIMICQWIINTDEQNYPLDLSDPDLEPQVQTQVRVLNFEEVRVRGPSYEPLYKFTFL